MRLRTITGTRFPSKCACGCGQGIPCDPDVKVVVDFDTSRPRLSYIPAHSPDFATYVPRGARSTAAARPLPGIDDPASETAPGPFHGPPAPPPRPRPPSGPKFAPETSSDAQDASPSPEAGRAWASGQLVFNAGQFESARAGFAAYALDGETAEQLRARVNRIILEDLEQKVLALRALHEKLGSPGHGPPSRTPSSAPTGGETSPRADLPRSTHRDPTLEALISRIQLVVEGDLLYPRRIAKEAAVREALAIRGLQVLWACKDNDREALEALADELDAIDAGRVRVQLRDAPSRFENRVQVTS